MAFSNLALDRLASRSLDPELLDRMGFDSVLKRWPVQRENGKTDFVEVDALLIPFFRNGELVRRKFKAWNKPEGAPAYLQEKGGVRCVWNEDALRDDSLIGQDLIITEGELDAAAAIESGFARSISVPDGAPPPGERDKGELEDSPKYAWMKDVAPYLTRERAPVIILAVDGDENGAALLQDLSVLLNRGRCKYLVYPKAPASAQERLGRERCKDLNEVKQFYGQKGVVETINRAQWVQVNGVYKMSDLPPVPELPTYEIGFEKYGEHYKIRMGDFVVLTGVPGLGKSTFVNDLMCRVTMNHGLKIGWASFEQMPQRDHRRALRSWYGVPAIEALDVDPVERKWPHEHREGRPVRDMTPAQIAEADAWIDRQHVFIVPNEDDDVTLNWMLDRMEVAVVRHGVKILIIDPWNEMEHRRDRDETMTEYVGRGIKELKRFAKKFQVHLLVVAHPTKSIKDGDGNYKMPTLYDVSDSANWYNKCDLGIVVHREGKHGQTVIKTQKSKYHEVIGRPGEVWMDYSIDDRRFRESGRIS